MEINQKTITRQMIRADAGLRERLRAIWVARNLYRKELQIPTVHTRANLHRQRFAGGNSPAVVCFACFVYGGRKGTNSFDCFQHFGHFESAGCGMPEG